MVRIFVCASALLFLSACQPTGDDDDSASQPGIVYQYADGEASDAEPNDALGSAQDLGIVGPGFVLTGSAGACGNNGTWDAADTDWFRVMLATGDPLEFRLDMWEGDLDLAIFDEDGELVVDAAVAGLDDEVVLAALDPETPWFFRIRCWQGNPGALWRLRVD